MYRRLGSVAWGGPKANLSDPSLSEANLGEKRNRPNPKVTLVLKRLQLYISFGPREASVLRRLRHKMAIFQGFFPFRAVCDPVKGRDDLNDYKKLKEGLRKIWERF